MATSTLPEHATLLDSSRIPLVSSRVSLQMKIPQEFPLVLLVEILSEDQCLCVLIIFKFWRNLLKIPLGRPTSTISRIFSVLFLTRVKSLTGIPVKFPLEFWQKRDQISMCTGRKKERTGFPNPLLCSFFLQVTSCKQRSIINVQKENPSTIQNYRGQASQNLIVFRGHADLTTLCTNIQSIISHLSIILFWMCTTLIQHVVHDIREMRQ